MICPHALEARDFLPDKARSVLQDLPHDQDVVLSQRSLLRSLILHLPKSLLENLVSLTPLAHKPLCDLVKFLDPPHL